MSREIKFREWDSHEKRMIDWDELSHVFDLGCILGDSLTWTVMQYTGLKDKNDKEIYEGDIVRHLWSSSGKYIGLVEMVLGCWSINGSQIGYVEEDELEVIGNVWENPELLES